VIAVSSHVFGRGDARPLTLCMMAAASALLLIICLTSGEFALPQTSGGWVSFLVASELYGFAIIAFFIAISMIGPLRTSLIAYTDAVISAGLGVVFARSDFDGRSDYRYRIGHRGVDRRRAIKIAR
jgi:drug/metabolite transporter (DMT)-like permease